MSQDRRFERLSTSFHAEVRSRDTGAVIGHLSDISLGGAMLVSETPQTVGTTLSLSVELPRGSRMGEHVPVEATVRWCEPDLAPGLYSLGLAFTGSGDAPHLLQRALGDA